MLKSSKYGSGDYSSGGESYGGSSGGGGGGLEELVFKILPDGSVEEMVKGVKGGECHKVTNAINAKLGEVIATQPTEEFYEQEIFINNEVTIKQSGSDFDGSSEW
eukprot:CAMPEP_0194129392 /NCGR_PEP_ID=MMETSP0152-20130528/631_1 /TAXON_ID=1049557 /ORGANISM="Thalassiothrix antarctica, Strain L6-D1" /LENGTH=104 /DNA_ID=CAMNT_0038823571 /DNA_START=144 /DNA_END=458 /DNA_ORIENTATION=+